MSLLQEADVFLNEPKEWRISSSNVAMIFHVLQIQLSDKQNYFRASIEQFTLKHRSEITFNSFCRAYEQ